MQQDRGEIQHCQHEEEGEEGSFRVDEGSCGYLKLYKDTSDEDQDVWGVEMLTDGQGRCGRCDLASAESGRVTYHCHDMAALRAVNHSPGRQKSASLGRDGAIDWWEAYVGRVDGKEEAVVQR